MESSAGTPAGVVAPATSVTAASNVTPAARVTGASATGAIDSSSDVATHGEAAIGQVGPDNVLVTAAIARSREPLPPDHPQVRAASAPPPPPEAYERATPPTAKPAT